MEVREVPGGGIEVAGVTGLVEGEFGDSGIAGNVEVASESAGEFLGEEVFARVEGEVP